MVDGQRIHRVIGKESENTTRSQAERFVERTRTEAKEQRLALPKGRKLHLTFSGAADLYLAKLKETGGKDYDNNEQHLRLHLTPYFGAMRLDRLSRFTLDKYRRHCIEKGLSSATVNRTLATYRRMARRLLDWEVIERPLPSVIISREQNRREYVLSDSEVEALKSAALSDSNSYVWLFLLVGLNTSLRHSEILAARFENLDSERRRLRVKVKGGRWREQPLTKTITDILLREHEMADDEQEWIFPSKTSRAGHIESMKTAFRRIVVAARLDPVKITPHTLRHSAITYLSESGADIPTIKEFSGHRSLEMVMRYAHARDKQVDAALDRLEKGKTKPEPVPIRNRQSS